MIKGKCEVCRKDKWGVLKYNINKHDYTLCRLCYNNLDPTKKGLYIVTPVFKPVKRKCKQCKNVFLRTGKSQKFCPACRQIRRKGLF